MRPREAHKLALSNIPYGVIPAPQIVFILCVLGVKPRPAVAVFVAHEVIINHSYPLT